MLEGISTIMTGSQLLADKANRVLKGSHHNALRKLNVEGAGDSIIISGEVHSFYLKQLAQEAVMCVQDGLHLQNRVKVANAQWPLSATH